MQTIHDALAILIRETVAESGLDPHDLERVSGEAVAKAIPELADLLCEELKRRAPQMLRERRKNECGFQNRNLRRWRAAFNTIEMIWVIAEEAGEEFNAEFRPQATL